VHLPPLADNAAEPRRHRAAARAHASVAVVHAPARVAWVAPHTPLVHAPRARAHDAAQPEARPRARAERPTTRRHLASAVAAERPPARPARQLLGAGPPRARERPGGPRRNSSFAHARLRSGSPHASHTSTPPSSHSSSTA
jgi:hypothetical protein